MHAAHHYNVGIGAVLCRFLSESERVAYIIGDVLNGTVDVIMGKDNGILVLFQL